MITIIAMCSSYVVVMLPLYNCDSVTTQSLHQDFACLFVLNLYTLS